MMMVMIMIVTMVVMLACARFLGAGLCQGMGRRRESCGGLEQGRLSSVRGALTRGAGGAQWPDVCEFDLVQHNWGTLDDAMERVWKWGVDEGAAARDREDLLVEAPPRRPAAPPPRA
jgi:hypothetical protein